MRVVVAVCKDKKKCIFYELLLLIHIMYIKALHICGCEELNDDEYIFKKGSKVEEAFFP